MQDNFSISAYLKEILLTKITQKSLKLVYAKIITHKVLHETIYNFYWHCIFCNVFLFLVLWRFPLWKTIFHKSKSPRNYKEINMYNAVYLSLYCFSNCISYMRRQPLKNVLWKWWSIKFGKILETQKKDS